MRRVDNIDDDVSSVNEWEDRQTRQSVPEQQAPSKGKALVGTVDQFFDRINVAAIKLTSSLKVGDIIEIGNEEEAIRQRVTSMQINREDVPEAAEGDDIGIKVNHPVAVGSEVYKIE